MQRRPRLRAHLFPIVVAALLSAGLCGRAWGQDANPLKAAVLFNLLGFVQWPGEAELPANTPLRVCAERGSPMWPHLMALNDRVVRQFRLTLREASGADASPTCDVWLVEHAGAARRAPLRMGAPGPVLMIGDAGGADEPGVVIALRLRGERVVFDIDMAAARRNGLQISSKLLRLARSMRE
jgi:hypothetical protein